MSSSARSSNEGFNHYPDARIVEKISELRPALEAFESEGKIRNLEIDPPIKGLTDEELQISIQEVSARKHALLEEKSIREFWHRIREKPPVK